MNDCPDSVHPEWVRAKGAEFWFGIKRGVLNGWVSRHLVTAKKLDKVVVYRYADILAAINSAENFTPTKG